MNFRILFLLLILPLSLHAEIYKWKDSNGVVRYSDKPPSAKTPYESIGSKKATVAPPPQPAENAELKKPAATDKTEQKKSSTSQDTNAIKRQQAAEETKKKDQSKETELKQKQQNCATAKANLQTYKQGGRIYKATENGEREFMSDADIAQGLAQAEKDIDQYCAGN